MAKTALSKSDKASAMTREGIRRSNTKLIMQGRRKRDQLSYAAERKSRGAGSMLGAEDWTGSDRLDRAARIEAAGRRKS